MFGMITPQVFWALSPEDLKLPFFDYFVYPIESHIHCLWFILAKYFVAIITAVELSTWIYVGPRLQPISFSMVRIGIAGCTLMMMVPYSASYADAMTLRMILQTNSMILLTLGMKSSVCFGLGWPSLRKWTPLARLLSWETESYDMLEWIANCIPIARYLISVFRLGAT